MTLKERPIIFRSDMVRANFELKKDMTRRIRFNCAVGDLLWVREAFCVDAKGVIHFRASAPYGLIYSPADRLVFDGGIDVFPRWKPSIHLRREAARLLLLVTGLRTEALQDISEDDARREGVTQATILNDVVGDWDRQPDVRVEIRPHRRAFAGLWDRINKERGFGWVTNPTVKVIEFKIEAIT